MTPHLDTASIAEQLAIRLGEELHARSRETVERYNERVGAEVLTWHSLRYAINPGVLTRAGHRIRIPSRRYGRRLFVSFEAIDRWAEAVTHLDAKPTSSHTAQARSDRTPRRRQRLGNAERAVAAERFLETEGV